MKQNDYLMKKWCFGFSRGKAKAREEAAMNANGELQTYRTYPKYRTIVFKVEKATLKDNQWTVEGTQYASLTGKPKKTKLVLTEKKGLLYAPNQKRPFLRIQDPGLLTEDGIPPVGSLITVDKKHAIVTAVERNQLTVFVNGQVKTVVCRPGQIRWHSDKVLISAVEKS
tara:strand:+ start:6997 stop:7503 length:507 start_codon:yes stop_codon:yes gene_type:complete